MPSGDNPNSKANLRQGPGRWVKGAGSPNPGGRPSIAKALEANGTNAHGITAELVATALKEIRNPTSAAGFAYAHKWLTDYAAQLPKPKENLHVEGSLSPEDAALLMALRMTPHERRQAIEAQETTAPPDVDS